MMNAYLRNTWFKIGLVIVVVGWGPLLAIILLAAIGLWPDPNPNPIGPGLLFMVTMWPAIICLGIGVLQVNRRGTGGSSGVAASRAAASRGTASRAAAPSGTASRAASPHKVPGQAHRSAERWAEPGLSDHRWANHRWVDHRWTNHRWADRRWAEHPAVRVVAGISGVLLIIYGVRELLDGEGRGAAAAIVIGFAGGYWAVAGRLPSWFRR